MTQPKTVSFGPTPFAGDRQNLALEQALLLRALQNEPATYGSPLLDTGAFKVANAGGIGDALAAAKTKQAIELNRKKSADLEGRYQDELVKELRKYRTAQDGGTVESGTIDGQAVTERTPGNPQAYKQFRDNPFPEVRAEARLAEELYQKQFEELGKRASFPSLQQAIQSGQGSIGQLQAKPEYKELGGALMNVGDTGQPPSVVPSTRVTQTKLPTGTVVNQYASGEQKAVDTAPKISTTVQNMPGNEVLKGRITKLEEGQEMALKQVDTLRATEQALTALAAGATTGFGAEWLQNLRTAATMLTGVQFPENTPTAVLQKALAENVVNKFSGKLGSGVSNADVLFMGKASGDLATDAAAIERILAIQAAAAQREIKRHNQLARAISPYVDKTLGEGITAELYSVEEYQPRLKFATDEAAIAYESGITGKTLAQTREEHSKFKAKTASSSEEAIKKRMQDLGLPYTPPPKGK